MYVYHPHIFHGVCCLFDTKGQCHRWEATAAGSVFAPFASPSAAADPPPPSSRPTSPGPLSWPRHHKCGACDDEVCALAVSRRLAQKSYFTVRCEVKLRPCKMPPVACHGHPTGRMQHACACHPTGRDLDRRQLNRYTLILFVVCSLRTLDSTWFVSNEALDTDG